MNAKKNETANLHFRELLKQKDSNRIDDLVFKLNDEISEKVDCTKCGNCCRSLMINVNDADAARLSAHLQIDKEDFYNCYVERSSQGSLAVMNTIPCHFLDENKCTVYEARPNECREFPGLHHPGFTKRLFTIFMHYGRCPIIYNVVEKLKEEISM
ncbi:YkgJ family cysteine cluster protein [Panacibacter ginsenosidivorans]|nr:YkgJ family cysteine cluster protein [Panacibacter ginsenosidivorans]